MKQLKIFRWKIQIDRQTNQTPQVKDPTVRFLQWGIFSTGTFWAGLALGMYPTGLAQWITSRGAAIQILSDGVIALFTGTLWYATRKMGRTTDETLRHLHRESIANNPPEIEIKDVSLSQTPDGGIPLSVVFFLENIGKSIATIDYCVAGDSYRGGRPTTSKIHNEVGGTKLLKYESLPVTHILQTITTEQLDSRNPTLDPQFEVQVFYHDEEGSQLEATALFRWIFEQKRFVVVP